MLRKWVETKEYQLKNGRWVPKAQVFIETPGGIDQHHIMSSSELTFDTQGKARECSHAIGLKWLEENG